MRRFFYSLITAAILASALEATGLVAVFGLINIALDPAIINTVPVLKESLDALGFDQNASVIVLLAVAVAVFYCAKNIFLSYVSYCQYHFTNLTAKFISVKLFRYYLEAPFSDMASRNSADLVININQAPHFLTSRIIASAVSITV